MSLGARQMLFHSCTDNYLIYSGSAPQTELVHPSGTEIKSSAAIRYRNQASQPLSRMQSRVHTGAATPITTLDPNHGGAHASAVAAALSASSEKGEKEQLSEIAVPHADGYSDLAPSEAFPNAWAKFRNQYKEYLAEFIATGILIIFGNGVNCQVVLSKLTQGSYLSISHGWGIGVMAGVYAAGGISGAHLSP